MSDRGEVPRKLQKPVGLGYQELTMSGLGRVETDSEPRQV